MIRALHLSTLPRDFQTDRSAAMLRRGAGAGFEVESRTIGRGGDYRNVAMASWALRGRDGVRRFDIVHAWDEPSLTAAVLAGAERPLFSPMRPLRRSAIGWLRAIRETRKVHVICPTATQRRVCVERGLPADACLLVRPGVDFATARGRRDAALRQSFGFDDSDHVLLLAGESTGAADHEGAVWAASILGVLSPKWRVLLWGRGPRAHAAALLGDQLNQPRLAQLAEREGGRRFEFEDLLPAADTVLVTARAPVATLPIAICMAAGLPIVGTVTYTVAELLEDRHTAVMCPPANPRLLARRTLDLSGDAQLRWAIADMARTEAFEFFGASRFLSHYRTLYRQLAAGEPLTLPEAAAGAGMRFHGRG